MRFSVADMQKQAFDAVAVDYDCLFTHRLPGRWYRAVVWSHLSAKIKPGDRILDLGCGTGEDAIWLAKQGIHVTAVDISREMLKVAQEKANATGVAEFVSFVQADLSSFEPGDLGFDDGYNGTLSDFGVINCLSNLKRFARNLSTCIRPGGWGLFVIMGPICPWEIVWYLLHGEVKKAFRRFHSTALAHVGRGETMPVRYPSVGHFRNAFSPYFKKLRTVGLGTFLPPPYLADLVERTKFFFTVLARLESRAGSHFPCTWLNDHYIVIMQAT